MSAVEIVNCLNVKCLLITVKQKCLSLCCWTVSNVHLRPFCTVCRSCFLVVMGTCMAIFINCAFFRCQSIIIKFISPVRKKCQKCCWQMGETLSRLETEYELQDKITSAYQKLTRDMSVTKSIRRSREQCYRNACSKVSYGISSVSLDALNSNRVCP